MIQVHPTQSLAYVQGLSCLTDGPNEMMSVPVPCLIPLHAGRLPRQIPFFESIIGYGTIHECTVIETDGSGKPHSFLIVFRIRRSKRNINTNLLGIFGARRFPIDVLVMKLGVAGNLINLRGAHQRDLARNAVRR